MEKTAITINDVFNRLEEIRKQYRDGLIDKTDTLSFMTILLVAEVIANSKDNRLQADSHHQSVERLRKIQEIMLLHEVE